MEDMNKKNCLDLHCKQVLNSRAVALRVGLSSVQVKCQLNNKHFLLFVARNEILGLDASWAGFETCELEGYKI